MAVSVLCLFLMVPWVGLWSLIVAFPGHTRMFFLTSVMEKLCPFMFHLISTLYARSLFLVFVPSSENRVDPDQLGSDNEDT